MIFQPIFNQSLELVTKTRKIMKIKAVVRKRVLRNINAKNNSKGQKGTELKEYSVVLYCNDRGKVYYVSTGLTTTNPDMKGHIFNDSNVTSIINNAKSNRLQRMVMESEKYSLEHSLDSVESIKRAIILIVKGDSATKEKQGYLTDYILEYVNDGRHSHDTIVCYEQTVKKVKAFDAKATLESVDEDWLYRFVEYMKGEGMTTNGYAIPLRNLKAAFNWARRKKLTKNYPFADFPIKTARARKLVLSAQDLADFRDFPCEEWQEKYKDYFMLQFYLGGLDMVDLCHIVQIKGGRIKFYRHKNEFRENMVEVDNPVCKEAMELIKKHKSKEGKFLLDAMDHRASYKSFIKQMNKALKKIGYSRLVQDKRGKLRKVEYYPLIDRMTTKTTRRTFTTIAMRLGIPEPVVGMCLGHSWASSNTTQIYEWFDRTDVDKAIKKIANHISSLQGRPKEVLIEEIKEREGL